MKLYIIAGEASGDLHASNLMKQLKRLHPEVEFRGFGGDLMQQQGMTLVKHYRDTALMGFFEVAKNLRKILGFIELCKEDILAYNPDAIILVDYPGFNLRIAEFAKQKGFKVFYYISPQVWAWKASRVKAIKRDVDKMFVILPFEKDFYSKRDYDVEVVGHPLLDAIAAHSFDQKIDLDNNKPVVALLPGSRKQEIGKMLPLMLKVIPDFPGYQFVVAGVGSIEKDFYSDIIGAQDCRIFFNQTYSILAQAQAALVTSGTATLETALFNVPEVVCYKGNPISFWIGKRLVDVKYISLVNLVCNKEVVKELIQDDLTVNNLKNELQILLSDETYRQRIFSDYEILREKLGGAGASEKTARLILEDLKVAHQ